MKKLFFILSFLYSIFYSNAQSLQSNMQALTDVCLSIRSAIAAGDIDGLRNANMKFKNIKSINFSGFTPVLPKEFSSLNGHLIFQPEFVDSLIKLGKGKVYKYADKYTNRDHDCRGISQNGVYIKNVLLKGESSSIYKMIGNTHMELVFITEPKGLISVTIYDKKHNVYYKEHEKEKQGAAYRIHIFDLPVDGNTELQVTIQNICTEDISCVVLSN